MVCISDPKKFFTFGFSPENSVGNVYASTILNSYKKIK